jgi:hypothetical protein
MAMGVEQVRAEVMDVWKVVEAYGRLWKVTRLRLLCAFAFFAPLR